jgi:hypothetical protein
MRAGDLSLHESIAARTRIETGNAHCHARPSSTTPRGWK